MKTLCFSLLVVIAACGGKSPATSTTTSPPMTNTAAADDPTCPLIVPGTALSVEDTTDGIALIFVTTGDAEAVRTRAASLNDTHNAHNGAAGSLAAMFPATSTSRWTKIDGGARVELVASEPAGVAKLQSDVRMHAGHLTGGTCAM
jgi:hypothetical protein